jgi:hypothetical protein
MTISGSSNNDDDDDVREPLSKHQQTFLGVFDMGGGTTDVTIAERGFSALTPDKFGCSI